MPPLKGYPKPNGPTNGVAPSTGKSYGSKTPVDLSPPSSTKPPNTGPVVDLGADRAPFVPFDQLED